MYLERGAHAAFTGAPVEISSKPGSRFSAFDGKIWGKTLLTIPGRLIVQSWRSVNFGKHDLDSILILTFSSSGNQGRIDLNHVNVADGDVEGVRKGWREYYWKPWRSYLNLNP
jgi:activator of HSP90 ATPase